MEELVNYYEVLHCEKGATADQLKKSYQALARLYHPDKADTSDCSNTKFVLIQTAWSILKDPVKRRQYDAELSCQEYNEQLVYAVLNIQDLEYNSRDDYYTYDCRCGGTYSIQSDLLSSPIVIIECEECSLAIQVNVPVSK